MVKKRRQTPPVIIISLIDILIVLLIFLMVTTTFREQPAVKLVLPESKQKPKPGATDSAVIVTVTKQAQAPYFYVGKLPVTRDRLQSELNAAVQRNPQVSLAIRADTEAQFGRVVEVVEAGTAAQIKSFSYFLHEAIQP